MVLAILLRSFQNMMAPIPPTKKKLKVAIVGGGVSGLTCAVALIKQGVDVEVYEAAVRLFACDKLASWSNVCLIGEVWRDRCCYLAWYVNRCLLSLPLVSILL